MRIKIETRVNPIICIDIARLNKQGLRVSTLLMSERSDSAIDIRNLVVYTHFRYDVLPIQVS